MLPTGAPRLSAICGTMPTAMNSVVPTMKLTAVNVTTAGDTKR